MKIVLRIRRFDPQTDREPHDEDYPVEAEPTERILDALIRVKDEQDGSLSFRRSCGHGVCGSDAMIIAGAERLACKTLVRDVAQEDGTLIPIQPLRFLPVQRDLMVDQAVFFQKFKLVKPFLINGEPVKEKERIQSQAERAVFDDVTSCILCGACYSSCPVLEKNTSYVGPASARAGGEIHLRQQGPRAAREDVGAGRSRRGRGLRESLQLHAGVPSRDQDHEEHQRDKEAPREGQGRKRMKLHEFQAKGFLREYGIPVPEGRPASTPQEAKAIAASIGCPVMVKAQVLVGGRGKAGGVKMAKTPEEAEARARDILGMRIKGIEVQRVLVAAAVDIAAEFYMSLAVDRSGKAVQCIASASGGMDIEEIAATQPDRIVRFALDPEKGPVRETHYAKLATEFKGDGLSDQAWAFLQGMYRLFSEKDCSLVEINPCAKTPQGKLIAADAKVIFDDNALYRHPELENLRSPEEYGADEMDARSNGLSYVGLDGTIGCIVNGAGLSMATMDLIKHFGGSPANFLDVGGSSSPEKVLNALRIILKHRGLTAILINIFGGITRCDDIARGIVMARERLSIPVPLVIRLIGTNETEGRAILKGAGIDAYDDLTEAVRGVVARARSGDGKGSR